MEGMRSFIPASEHNSPSKKPFIRNRQDRPLRDEILTLGKGIERHCCVLQLVENQKGGNFQSLALN